MRRAVALVVAEARILFQGGATLVQGSLTNDRVAIDQ